MPKSMVQASKEGGARGPIGPEGTGRMTWRMLDLFSGIGGFSLAAQWVWGDELEIVAFCEIDKYCQKVLKKHWPNVPIIEDVRNVTADTIAHHEKQIDGWNIEEESERQIQEFGKRAFSRIDLLTGGFPCQPFSVAGKRKGKEDNRFLWPEMFAVIKEIRPRWVVAENVAGIVRMAFDDCLSDLESEDYSTQAVIIPACAVNAPHRRDRVWIVAHSKSRGKIATQQSGQWNGVKQGSQDESNPDKFNGNGSRFHSGQISQFQKTKIFRSKDVANISEQGLEGKKPTSKLSGREQGLLTQYDWWSTEPDVGRVAHGVPNRVDRLKSLGNAIVPQVAYQIFKAIKEIETNDLLDLAPNP